jgi:exopolysaccharide biosynthesis polyprenyl glycosylphosphotransferase
VSHVHANPSGLADLAAAPSRARRPLRPARLTAARQRLDPALACILFQIADSAALALAFCIGGKTIGWTAGLAAGAVTTLVLRLAGAYHFPRHERLRVHLAFVAVLTILVAVAMRAAVPAIGEETRLAAAAVLLVGLHVGWWSWVRRWQTLGLLTPNIVVVGATPVARELILDLVSGRSAGEANIIGIFDDRAARRPGDILGVPVLGPVEALLAHHALASVDRIVITVPPGAADRVAQLVERLSVLPHEITLVIDRDDDRVMGRIGAKSLAQLGGRRASMGQALAKRGLDIAVSATALVLISPALALIALAVVLDSPGPVFFRQTRHGFNNEAFRVWKFRSMRVEASDATASRQVTAGDARVTRVGRVIRSTSLDELPQLINILTGEMSLVGPRPHAIGMKSGGADAAGLIAVYGQRHRLKPGLTGWAAVNGSRGPVDDLESLQRRLKLDLQYIERQSFWFDIWIMLKTLPLVLGDSETAR